ncbi:1,2-dihydroxy-3-keto-5-methylthiopentene dioxygenase [Perkinsus olseni]|uniref:1,2-dihydroxy-3-keto-5-methylthiopentene dioxygenase n=1 Tax=Perkinsus olseni TaxID=32597 RepID=A0A7J6KS54_PEROL|nr:1,2-dihydroxy-3-keto-5-methylthiopentene dioxygenase [Perkinsus olseni]
MSMLTTGGPSAVARDLEEKGVDVAAIQECRWETEQVAWRCGNYIFWGGGAWRSRNGGRVGGVAIAINVRRKEELKSFHLINGRLAYVVMKGHAGRDLVIISAYGPTEMTSTDEKEKFWSDLDGILREGDINEIDQIVIAGDMNGETGRREEGCGLGKCAIGLQNNNGERLVDFANERGLNIVASIFKKRSRVKCTMRGNFQERDKRAVTDVRSRWDTYHHCDHALRMLAVKVKPCRTRGKVKRQLVRVLRSKEVAELVDNELKRDEYERIREEESEMKNGDRWNQLKAAVEKGVKGVEGEEVKRKPWISDATWEKMKLRNEMVRRIERGEEHVGHLKQVQREAKKMVKADKKIWIKQQTEKAEKAAEVNNLRELYSIIRLLGGKSYKGVDLTGMDVEVFVRHFKELLGEEVEEREEAYTSRRGFQIAEEMAERGGDTWRLNVEMPSDEEVEKVCKKMRNNKAAGVDELPSELFKNSEECRRLLAMIIRAFWRGEELTEECHTALLVTLFKGKGSKKSPEGYRGISLLSVVERVISAIVLERIKEVAEERLLRYQFGFTSGKSCRDPVRLLWKLWEGSERVASVFVDFRKAFDSLRWSNLWKILSASGMPMGLVDILRRLYDKSKITIRISPTGGVTEAFDQGIGLKRVKRRIYQLIG